jgi:hypothetical protein
VLDQSILRLHLDFRERRYTMTAMGNRFLHSNFHNNLSIVVDKLLHL